MSPAPQPVAVVTGAAGGIGQAIALALARDGFSLALPVRDADREAGNETVAMIAKTGSRAQLCLSDLAAVKTHAATAAAILAAHGRIDVLVNVAGISSVARGDMLDVAPTNYDAVLDINLRGTVFFTNAIARAMLDQTASPAPRSIITITSVSAELATLERTDYCISKAGLAMYVKALALRLAPHGIAVFDVRPGIIRTAMTSVVTALYQRRIEHGLVPAGRWGEATEVADAVAALATGRLAFATGSILNVDGGLSIPRL